MPTTKKARVQTYVEPDPGGVFSITTQIMRYRRPITSKELGELIGRSEDVVYSLAKKKVIPAFNVPGSKLIMFDPATVVWWLNKHNPLLKQVAKAS